MDRMTPILTGTQENTMFRKLTLALAAAGALGAASLASTTPAAAWHGGWHGGWGHHHFWGGPRIFVGGPSYVVADPCLRRRAVLTPWGYRYRTVNVCY
jgi:hypothetical protein